MKCHSNLQVTRTPQLYQINFAEKSKEASSSWQNVNSKFLLAADYWQECSLLCSVYDCVVQFLNWLNFISKLVQHFLNCFIFFIFYFLVFASDIKKYFLHLLDLLFIFPLLFIFTLLTLAYYSLPALPTSQPIFFLPQCLPCEPWTTDLIGFPLDSCPDALPVSHGDLNTSSPIFFNNIYYTIHSTSNTFPYIIQIRHVYWA